MYSRYHNEKTIKIPENYSGCAFAEQKTSSVGTPPYPREHFSPAQEVRRMEVAKPTLPEPISKPALHEEPKTEKEPISKEEPVALPVSSPLGGLGKSSFLPQGLGFEELLILGLILLLSQSEQDSDIVLWLALLLFCG